MMILSWINGDLLIPVKDIIWLIIIILIVYSLFYTLEKFHEQLTEKKNKDLISKLTFKWKLFIFILMFIIVLVLSPVILIYESYMFIKANLKLLKNDFKNKGGIK